MAIGAKAAVGAGSIPLSSALVAVVLWGLGLTPPQEIVVSIQAIVGTVIAYPAVYFTPHK